jgi:hypothetical protein
MYNRKESVFMNTNINSAIEKLIEMGYEAKTMEVQKNNGITKVGITVKVVGTNIAPTLYFTGKESVDEIVDCCVRKTKTTPKLEKDIKDWDTIRSGLTLSLVNYDLNKDRDICIRQIPGTDLGIIVKYLALDDEVMGRGFITVTPRFLEIWGVSEDTLFIVAEDAFQNVNDYNIKSMTETLCELQGMEYDPTMELFAPTMDIVSNESKCNGAVVVINKNCQKELSKKYNGNFFIIPSSIHECIILPYDEENKRMMIESGMISEVNSTEVAPEEVLSDKLYYYDAEEDCIKVA